MDWMTLLNRIVVPLLGLGIGISGIQNVRGTRFWTGIFFLFVAAITFAYLAFIYEF